MPPKTPRAGLLAWVDLTVPDAARIRQFYEAVVGWRAADVDMGEYSDYMMHSPSTDEGVTGICWKRGVNATLPSQWLVYILVESLRASVAACREQGGEVLLGPKTMGAYGDYCVIRDPAGAVCALIEERRVPEPVRAHRDD